MGRRQQGKASKQSDSVALLKFGKITSYLDGKFTVCSESSFVQTIDYRR